MNDEALQYLITPNGEPSRLCFHTVVGEKDWVRLKTGRGFEEHERQFLARIAPLIDALPRAVCLPSSEGLGPHQDQEPGGRGWHAFERAVIWRRQATPLPTTDDPMGLEAAQALERSGCYADLHTLCFRYGIPVLSEDDLRRALNRSLRQRDWPLLRHDPVRSLTDTRSYCLFHTQHQGYLRSYGDGDEWGGLDDAKLFETEGAARDHRQLLGGQRLIAVVGLSLRVEGPIPENKAVVDASQLGKALAVRDADVLDETLAPATATPRGVRL